MNVSKPVPSAKELRVLEFCRGFWKANGYSPSYRDICTAVDTSTSVARFYIERLARMGYVDYTPGIARSIRLIKQEVR